MPFLALNGSTFRIQSNGMGEKYNEHGVDRFRTFDGAMRVTRRGIYREWNGNTAILTDDEAAPLLTLLKGVGVELPLALTGDLVAADETVAVMPILISNDPIQTATGFKRRVVFALHETPAQLPPDTSAPIFMFMRRGVGMWQDWAATIPTLEGDPIARWDDRITPNDRCLIGGLDFNFQNYVSGDAPVRENGRARFDDQRFTFAREAGFSTGMDGHGAYTGTAGDDLSDLDGTGCEIMIGVQVDESPPALAGHGGLWFARWGGAATGSPDGSGSAFHPHSDGHIYEHFGLADSVDIGAVSDLDSFHCYDVVAFDNGIDPREWTVRLNETVLYTTAPAGGAISLVINPIIGLGAGLAPDLYGTIRDIVINTGQFTTRQRASWRDYILGVTDDPPLP